MFLQSHLLATDHAHRSPSKPKICLKRPSWTPQEGPRRAQDSPRWAQDGPKTGRQSTGKSSKILFGALLGPPWGQLGPLRSQLGPSKPILKPICHPSRFLGALKITTRPPNRHFASFLVVPWPTKSAKAPDNQDTKKPMNQCSSSRGRSGGMRGAIESAAPEGEQGVMKPECQNLSNSDKF